MPKPRITPAQARLALKRADIEQMIVDLQKQGGFVSVGPVKTQEEAVALHHKRIKLCDKLMELNDDALADRHMNLCRNLSPHHLACWVSEARGLKVRQADADTIWAEPGDFDKRVEIDLIIIALGGQP